MSDLADSQGTDTAGEVGAEQTVLPSPNVVSLKPSNRDRYLARLSDCVGDPAEHFLLNTQLRPGELSGLPSQAQASSLREWFLSSRRAFEPGTLVEGAAAPEIDIASLAPRLARLLSIFGVDGPMGDSLFNLDLNLILDGTLHLLPPRTDRLVFERTLQPEPLAAVRAALLEDDAARCPDSSIVVCISVVPQRSQILYGPRGLRLVLMEAGVMLANFVSAAVSCSLAPHPVMHFSNWDIDALVGNDGLERTSLALVILPMTDEIDGEGQ